MMVMVCFLRLEKLNTSSSQKIRRVKISDLMFSKSFDYDKPIHNHVDLWKNVSFSYKIDCWLGYLNWNLCGDCNSRVRVLTSSFSSQTGERALSTWQCPRTAFFVFMPLEAKCWCHICCLRAFKHPSMTWKRKKTGCDSATFVFFDLIREVT